MVQNRRSFLKTAGMATAVASAAPLALSMRGGLPGDPSPVAAMDGRSYVAGRFALELEGKSAGILSAYGGGFPYGVVAYGDGDGDDPIVHKHISNVKYEEITIQISSDVDEALWNWVADTMDGKAPRKSGSVIFLDEAFNATRALDFHDALITEITFPAMDGSSKETAHMTVVISPESTSYVAASGKVTINAGKQKKWLTSNFRCTLGDMPTKRVSKIDSFTIKQGIIEAETGERRRPQIEPAKLEIPNLSITLSEVDSDPWFKYFDDFVIRRSAEEISGVLEYLAPDMKTVLGSVAYAGVGIFKCAPDKLEAGGQQIKRIRSEMYVERMVFTPPPGQSSK